MIEVKLKKGKNVIDPDRGLRKFKKALMKEGTLRELKNRSYFVSEGRQRYLQRCHRDYVNSKANQN